MTDLDLFFDISRYVAMATDFVQKWGKKWISTVFSNLSRDVAMATNFG